ncbi:MAG: fumarylacetoacetate hydrolase family protein [Bacteroidales bacterium]|nr:fumarylacetoacetate hydrolase family protein [Bacteroidales bacterium]
MKIICIGRNYIDHVKEMNNKIPEYPVFFVKSENSLLLPGENFRIPDFSNEIHYEGELVFRVDENIKNTSEEEAMKYVSAVTIGIDFTARDIQRRCIERGEPWEIAKSFDGSAAVGKFLPFSLSQLPYHFSLKRNETIMQASSSDQMIFSLSKLIAYVSKFMTLCKNDLIFTGTPSGIGKVERGDVLKGFINDILLLEVKVV